MKQILIIYLFTLAITAAAEKDFQIFVISFGQHSGIVIQKENADLDYILNKSEFDKAEYIEYGFGDKDYYMSKTAPSLYIGAKAVLWPTNSVMKVIVPDMEKYKNTEDATILPITLSEKQLLMLKEYIKNSFLLDNDMATPISKSPYDKGIFYKGTHDFYLFNTCNSWVVKALKYSGIKVSDWFIVTRGNLKSEISDISK